MTAAIILAAGESSRLGAFKPLLPWPDEGSPTTLTAFQVEHLRLAGCWPIIAVVGNRATEVAAVAREAGATVVVNPHFRDGKATSVRAGVAAVAPDAPLLIVGVDQPRPAWFYSVLTGAPPSAGGIIIPTYGDRRGHPPVFGPHLYAELAAVEEATFGLRAVVKRDPTRLRLLEIESPITLVNLNTADDIGAAREMKGWK